MQNMSFSGSELNQNVSFRMQTFYQKLTSQKLLISKSNALYFLDSKSNAL